MNKLLISVATCGIRLSSVAFAAPIPSAESGLGASETTTIKQVKLSKKMMMKKKMMWAHGSLHNVAYWLSPEGET